MTRTKPRLLTLSFDDGFLRSFTHVAAIYEKRGLSACLNVNALGHRPELFAGYPDDLQVGCPKGDFALWNELVARGHEVMPHGLAHEDHARLPLAEAQSRVQRCLEIFASELKGFDARRAVFNLSYNSATAELEAWLPSVVRAFRGRAQGGMIFNPLPHPGLTRISTAGFGPAGTEEHFERTLDELLARDSGWLLYNLHGLDGEGWGPVRSGWLERQLDRLMAIDSLAMLPAARALAEADAAAGSAHAG
jgi:peptidoglycan/xylan/chitin deacetylase (PgdA/CDA1 family)